MLIFTYLLSLLLSLTPADAGGLPGLAVMAPTTPVATATDAGGLPGKAASTTVTAADAGGLPGR